MAHPQGLTVASVPAEKAQARGSAVRFPRPIINEIRPTAAIPSSTVIGSTQPKAAVISLGLRILVQAMPFLAILVGVGLVGLGLWLLFGGSLRLSIPTPRINAQARNPKSVFLYGAAYGFASLSCTLPIFMIVIGSSLATGSPGEAAAMFGSFAAGMATVLMAVVISIALVKGAIVQQLQAVLPYVHRIGAGLLVVAGLYLIWYQARYLPLFLATF